jgi:hypothetical protein
MAESGPLNRDVARRQRGGGALTHLWQRRVRAPDAELWGSAKGPGELAGSTAFGRTLCRCGNCELINKQAIWYRIRIFGDDQHLGDLPRVDGFYAKVEIAHSKVSRATTAWQSLAAPLTTLSAIAPAAWRYRRDPPRQRTFGK